MVVKTGDFLVDYATQSTLSASAQTTKQGVADLDSSLGVVVLAQSTLTASSALSTQTTLAVTSTRTTQGSAVCANAFAQTVEAQRIRSTSAAFSVTTQIDTDAQGGFIGLVLTGLLSTAGLSATGTRIQQGAATLNSTTTQTALGLKTVGFSADLVTTATLASELGRIRPFSASFEAFNSQISAVARRAAGVADLDSEFTMSTIGVVFAENETPLDVSTTLSVTPSRIQQGASTLAATVQVAANAIKAVEAGATLLSAGGFALSANTTASGAFDLDTATTISADCSLRAGGASNITTSMTLSVEPNQIKGVDVDITSTAGLSTNAGALLQGEVTINSAMSFAIISKVLHLQQYVYTIPKDTRIYTIERESRAYTIQQETRTYTIEGE